MEPSGRRHVLKSAVFANNSNAPSVASRGHSVQGGKGIPRPITLVRHAGSGPLELLGEDALALSKMNWNNDALFDSLPVTIEYSQRLSKTIARATSLPSGVYPYRLFM
jgi:argonaute-like protein implicated in RNA metabolism and viral defense